MNTTTTAPAAPVYKVRGTTADVTECGICGRSELKGTIVLDLDGAIVYAGSDCGSRLAGMPAAKVRAAAKRADSDARAARLCEWNIAREDAYLAAKIRLGYAADTNSLAIHRETLQEPGYRAAMEALGPYPV
jgi:hypothetical protein